VLSTPVNTRVVLLQNGGLSIRSTSLPLNAPSRRSLGAARAAGASGVAAVPDRPSSRADAQRLWRRLRCARLLPSGALSFWTFRCPLDSPERRPAAPRSGTAREVPPLVRGAAA